MTSLYIDTVPLVERCFTIFLIKTRPISVVVFRGDIHPRFQDLSTYFLYL